jgi:hypothetical protein
LKIQKIFFACNVLGGGFQDNESLCSPDATADKFGGNSVTNEAGKRFISFPLGPLRM